MADEPLTRATLKTPKAAAIAGMLFSILLIIVFSLLRISVPADPQEPGAWLQTDSGTVALALNLVPFAGIAFLWFIGVLRERLRELEDRFFATVFFGSGLLFLAMLFTAAALIGGILVAFATKPEQLAGTCRVWAGGTASDRQLLLHWSFVVFPLWVGLLSMFILMEDMRRPA